MSYIVEQKIKGNIYLYRVECYWDKDKKQPRQKRIYLGPKNKKKKKVNLNTANIIHKKFGNMFLLKDIAENLGLRKLLEENFRKSWEDIFNLACFFVCDERASYLYNHCAFLLYLPVRSQINLGGFFPFSKPQIS